MPAEDLFDERDAIAGLTFVERVGPVLGKNGKPTGSVVDRYTYPQQEVEIGSKGKLHARDGKAFGEVVAHDRLARLIDIRKGPSRAEEHPSEVFACDVISDKRTAAVGDAAGATRAGRGSDGRGRSGAARPRCTPSARRRLHARR